MITRPQFHIESLEPRRLLDAVVEDASTLYPDDFLDGLNEPLQIWDVYPMLQAGSDGTMAEESPRIYLGSVFDMEALADLSQYEVTIDWGDGTISAGRVIDGWDLPIIVGDHDYTAAGSYVVSFTVSRGGATPASASTTGPLEVFAVEPIDEVEIGLGDPWLVEDQAQTEPHSDAAEIVEQTELVTDSIDSTSSIEPATAAVTAPSELLVQRLVLSPTSIATDLFQSDRAVEELDTNGSDIVD